MNRKNREAGLIKQEIEKLKDWAFTLAVAEKNLPGNAHIEHYTRLRDMQEFFRWKVRELGRELENLQARSTLR
jgi:hypothetical protein